MTIYGLYDDCTLEISDGVGYIDTLNRKEVEELYISLKKLIEGESKNQKKKD